MIFVSTLFSIEIYASSLYLLSSPLIFMPWWICFLLVYISEIKEAKQNKQRSLDVNFFGFLKRLLVHGSTIGSVVVVEQ